MKKIIIILLLIIGILFLSTNSVSANPPEDSNIEVSVPIDMSNFLSICKEGEKKGKYICEVPRGTGGFQIVMAGIVKYAIFISSLAGVLFIVINGILYSMAGMSDSLKTEAKDRIVKTLIGIVLLLMSGTILHILAPWVYS